MLQKVLGFRQPNNACTAVNSSNNQFNIRDVHARCQTTATQSTHPKCIAKKPTPHWNQLQDLAPSAAPCSCMDSSVLLRPKHAFAQLSHPHCRLSQACQRRQHTESRSDPAATQVQHQVITVHQVETAAAVGQRCILLNVAYLHYLLVWATSMH